MVGTELGKGVVGPNKLLLRPELEITRWGEWSGARGVSDKLLQMKFTLVVPCLYQVAGLYVLLLPPLRSALVASCWWPVIGLWNLLLG